MKESTEMEDYDGYLDKFQKQHSTKILPLRWFANLCEIPAHYHLGKALHYDDHDDHGFVYRYHAFLSHWFYKPYLKWGTTYVLDMEKTLDAWKEDPEMQELMKKLGSDYDENGVAYWEKNE
jgi:hypothetical protein